MDSKKSSFGSDKQFVSDVAEREKAGGNEGALLATVVLNKTAAVESAAAPPPPTVVGSITLDGGLGDWTSANQIDKTLSVSGYDIYAKGTSGWLVFALKAPAAIGANTTAWLNTDLNAATGYRIWGFAGGAEYNVNFDSTGTPRLYTGDAGQTLVSGVTVLYTYSADRTIVEFAVPTSGIGSPAGVDTLWDVNNATFLPTDFSTTPYRVSPIGVSRTGDAGNNTLNGTNAEDTLSGLAGNDTLSGFGGNDTLQGGDGTDMLNGGAGADRMTGGTGNDTYVIDNAGDVVTEGAAEGTDLVQSSVTYTLGSTVENLTLTGASAINGTGNGAVNTIVGNAAANTLSGGAGNDTIDGGAGNDILNGGTGADRLTGGMGADRFQYSALGDAGDTIVDFTRGASDQLDISRLLTGYTAGSSNINNFVRLSGTTSTTVAVNADGVGTDFVSIATLSNVAMTGTLLSELITRGNLVLSTASTGAVPLGDVVGLTGSTVLDGLTQGGAWAFPSGGPRVITYSLSLNDTPGGSTWETSPLSHAIHDALRAWSSVANISFVERGSGTVFTSSTADIAITLATNELQPTGAAGLGVFPDPAFGDEFLSATGYSRSSYPRPEGDIFLDDASPAFSYGGSHGNMGLKVMLHEIGHALGLKHTYDDGGNGRPTFQQLGIAAYDSPRYTIMSQTPPTASLFSGNPATPMLLDIRAIQQIYGPNPSYNKFDDRYYWYESMQTIWDTGGNDTIDSPYTASAAIDLRPGALSTSGERVIAIAYGVTIENAIGAYLNDSIIGNDANNSLDGREGADRMEGGRGNDVYTVDNNGDTVVERAGEGKDTVFSSVGYTLAPNVEVLYLNSGANGTGNALDNEIYGNSAANVLIGNAGNDLLDGGGGGNLPTDTLRGGTGDDTYVVRSANDSVLELPGEGIDTIRVWDMNYALGANFENLELLQGFLNGTGNELANTIIGTPAPNVLNGGAGNDVLVGDFDSDTLTGGTGSDRFDYNSYWDGLDTITDFARGAGGDALDIKDALAGYTPGVSNINNFVRLSGTTSTTLSVNVDGSGIDFFALATLTNVAMSATLLNDMLAQGNLIVA